MPQPPVNLDELEDEEEEPGPPAEAADTAVEKSQAQLPIQTQSQASLKRQVEAPGQLANGHPPKRPRLGNADGLENGADTATSPMEIDQHQSDNHAYPSPLEGEQAPTPAPRTEGPDHATQTDKVEDLGPKTIYLRLSEDDSSSSSIAAPPTNDPSHSHTTHAPILLHCEWNPKDPSRLAAAGTDALARVWTVSRATGPDAVADHVDPGWPSIHLVSDDVPPNTKITALSWAYDGQQIAVATDDDTKARIDLWNLEGKQVHQWEGFESPIIKLRCNPLNRSVLGIYPAPINPPSTEPLGFVVTVLPSVSAGPAEYTIPDDDVFSHQPDAAWMNETDFVLCSGTKLATFRYAGGEITQLKEFVTRPNDILTEIQYDSRQKSGLIAVATSNGFIDVSVSPPLIQLSSLLDFCDHTNGPWLTRCQTWDASGNRQSSDNSTHDGRISVLRWQPRPNEQPDGERLLASGGEDGTIAIRDVRSPHHKPAFHVTIDDNPVLAIAFTPDGAFVAGATRDNVKIWKVGEYQSPRAEWSRKSHPGRLSPKVNGNMEPEDQHCLSWDSTGHKLAFGVNDLVSHYSGHCRVKFTNSYSSP